ncbi:MAG: DUF4330 domain-containing protein [Sulfobacillus sp.]
MTKRRLNPVDLILILIVVFAVLFIGEKFLPATSSAPTSSAHPMKIVFLSQPVPVWIHLASHVSVGAPVSAILGGTAYPLGTVASVSKLPARISAPNSAGQLTASVDPLSDQIQVTIDVQASGGTTSAYVVNNNPVYLGQQMVVELGAVQLTGYVEAVTP